MGQATKIASDCEIQSGYDKSVIRETLSVVVSRKLNIDAFRRYNSILAGFAGGSDSAAIRIWSSNSHKPGCDSAGLPFPP